ncbi:MAG: DUF2600 family protein [Solirubrobacteraceae bacterium]
MSPARPPRRPPSPAVRSLAGAAAFARAAPAYWLSVYPQVRRELHRQRCEAAVIADPELRHVALAALRDKRENVDGAAAFAAFVPARSRTAVLTAQVAFQALYDYLDVLTERPHPHPVARSRALHTALAAAIEPAGATTRRGDDLYVADAVARCRLALRQLPSYPAVAPAARRLAQRIVAFQSFNVADRPGPQRELAGWARAQTPAGSRLRWWETAASAGSSLGLFALVALAARPHATATQAEAIEHVYFPWIGALHSLLDSLVDAEEDAAAGQRNLLCHYRDERETAQRLALLTRESRRRASALPQPGVHLAILAAMASLYLVEPQAGLPSARPARDAVLAAVGGLATPAMLLLRMRRTLSGL